MTKEELSKLYFLNREIELLKSRLLELQNIATSCTSSITGMPHGSGVNDKIGKYAAEIADLRELLKISLKKCFYELNRLNRYIDSVAEPEIRMILALRYVNGFNWQQIAYSIGYQDESVPRKRHNRYLKKYL